MSPSTRTRRPIRSCLRPALTAFMLLVSLATSGCAVALWNRADLQLTRNISIGQEFLDLDKARAQGAITEGEYEILKEKLMKLFDLEGVIEIMEEVRDED